MDQATWEWLTTEDGTAALARAATAGSGTDPLAAAAAVRATGLPADRAGAVLTQTDLRRRAVVKFGSAAATMLFTRAGLEQATRPVVASRRARRLADAGVRRIADLGCGIGSDTLALAAAGLHVLAVDADPVTLVATRHNVTMAGLADRVEVRQADVTTLDLSDVDAVFCDPARRDGPRGQRVFHPDAFSPPWSFVEELIRRFPMAVLKLAPGLDHALIPPEAEAEWVSVEGDVVELALWSGPLSTVRHRATLLRGTAEHTLTGDGSRTAAVGPVGGHIYDPDGAVVRSHLVAEMADTVAGHLADAQIAHIHSDSGGPSPYGRRLRVEAELPVSVKRLRAALRAHDIGTLEILKRGLAVEPAQLRRDLQLRGSGSASLVLTRVLDRPTALLCQPSD